MKHITHQNYWNFRNLVPKNEQGPPRVRACICPSPYPVKPKYRDSLSKKNLLALEPDYFFPLMRP